MSHRPAKFCGHRPCSSGDIKVLVCHKILQDHAIRWSFYFMDKTLAASPTPAKFGGHGDHGKADMLLV